MGRRKTHLGEDARIEVGRCLLNVGQAVITVCLSSLLVNSLQNFEGEKSVLKDRRDRSFRTVDVGDDI